MIARDFFRANDNAVADGRLLKELMHAGLTWLEYNKENVNRLNVFPVPDGDTGTNMFLTMRYAYREIADMQETHVGKLSGALAEGALKGARGNSGVILSQLLAGAAKALEGHAVLTAELLVEATTTAVTMAYRAVEKPVEGTILTVSRGMAEAVRDAMPHTKDLVILLKKMLYAGRKYLRETPELLPVLKKAGVVDSGGQGLLYIFEGMMRSLCGRALTIDDVVQTDRVWQDSVVPDDEEGYGYDVQFLMRGENLDADHLKHALAAMGGWSTLVVGDKRLLKVHVHVQDPGEPISYVVTKMGATIEDVVVENMQQQYETYLQEQMHTGDYVCSSIDANVPAVITVASGRGIQQVFGELGAAYVIHGGQTMNPSTGDFIAAIEGLPNQDILIMPNNKNILLAAQQAAAKITHKRVLVIPTVSIPQGITAMVEYGCSTELDALFDIMGEASRRVTTCEVTIATRTVDIDEVSVREGQYIGLLDNRLVSAGDSLESVTFDLLRRADVDTKECITAYYGQDVSASAAADFLAQLIERHPNHNVQMLVGGQPLYPYIISVE